MKRYKYFPLILTILLFTTSLNAANIAEFGNVISNIRSTVSEAVNDRQFHSHTLDKIIEIEKPTYYQKEQIYAMFNDLCTQAQNSNLKSKKALISFINSLIPDTSANFFQDSVLFKYAFKESKGSKPKGFFDCDTRALMVMSVLEAIHKNDGIYIVDVAGHVLLTDTKTKQYYDLTLSDINVELEESKLLFSNMLHLDTDIESLIIGNVATDILMRNSDNVVSGRNGDKTKVEQAQELLKQAIQLNPKNIASINNLKASLQAIILEPWNFKNYEEYSKALEQRDVQKAIYDTQILSILVANYTDNYIAKIPNQFLYREVQYFSQEETDDASDFLKAFKNNSNIANYTLNTAFMEMYTAKLYQQVLRMGKEIVKDRNLDSVPGIYLFYYRLAVSAAMTGQYDLYTMYRNKSYSLMKNKTVDEAESLEYMDYAIKIIKGEITPEIFTQYNNDSAWIKLYKFVTENQIYNETFDTVDILENWEDFSKFKEKVIALTTP